LATCLIPVPVVSHIVESKLVALTLFLVPRPFSPLAWDVVAVGNHTLGPHTAQEHIRLIRQEVFVGNAFHVVEENVMTIDYVRLCSALVCCLVGS
jgi:hypothetical protein